MKKILLLIVLYSQMLLAQNYNYLGTFSSNGKPDYLEVPGDNVSYETLEMISNSLPESYPVPDYNPQYITAGYDTNIELINAAEVYVTFVSEGAGYRNVLGFYTYDLDNPPTSAPSEEDITIIFPNASALGSGGGLLTGDKVKIGSFPANTGIGWVLLANAWSSTYQTVGFGLWTLFSDPDFNPESDASLQHHNVLLSDPDNERVIMGFEDIRRDYGSCDNDFNDAVFYITASPYSALRINNVADISTSNDVTSSYDGGLESNGKLSQLIAKRNLERSKQRTHKNLKTHQEKFNKSKLLNKGETTIINYLPTTGMYGTETSKVSSPEDLVGITNAKEVFAVDYYSGEKRVSAVLATKTEGNVYDHSKAICDRLNNSSIEDVRTVITRGHKIVSSKIKRANGLIEYTLGFSVKEAQEANELHSYWNIEQYPTGDYYNFQVWGSTYSQVFSVANHILDTFISEKDLISDPENTIVPSVFVSTGKYLNGKLYLDLINKSEASEVVFDGNIQSTETSEISNMNTVLDLTGNWNESLVVETGVLFDIGFSISVSGSNGIDALYLADGPWGLDYLDAYASVSNFNVTNEEVNEEDMVYEVNRNISVEGEVLGNMNIFRHLLAGDQTLDITSYNYLSFTITNSNAVEIVLMQEGLEDWNSRYRYTIPANTEETVYEISLNEFTNHNGITANLTDVKTIVFSVLGDGVNSVPYSIAINEVAFSGAGTLNIKEVAEINEDLRIVNYPNPFKNITTIRLPKETDKGSIIVYDVLGRVVFTKVFETNQQNRKEFICDLRNVNSGVYKYLVKDDKKNNFKGTFIIAR
ncbi:conserved protein of unknown function precursor containing a T9SS type A C-terminal secretion signal [Tenacibaculum sp. 190524A02b]|uniref:DUF4114 domain-containing protein n=1 Tax=Tenacibaculum vairaonense TaxID=3137860 RepID=UPI0032B1967B